VFFYYKDIRRNPEWNWNLAAFVPKKYMLKKADSGNAQIYDFNFTNIDIFRAVVSDLGIQYLYVLEPTIPADNYYMNDSNLSSILNEQTWVNLKNIFYFKNKVLYVYEVITKM
jgi:hypothetical protein